MFEIHFKQKGFSSRLCVHSGKIIIAICYNFICRGNENYEENGRFLILLYPMIKNCPNF